MSITNIGVSQITSNHSTENTSKKAVLTSESNSRNNLFISESNSRKLKVKTATTVSNPTTLHQFQQQNPKYKTAFQNQQVGTYDYRTILINKENSHDKKLYIQIT